MKPNGGQTAGTASIPHRPIPKPRVAVLAPEPVFAATTWASILAS